MNITPSPNAALYTEDMLDSQSVTAIAASGFTTVIVGLFHVHTDGSLYYNDTPVDDSQASIIKQLKTIPGSKVQTVLFSIGGGNWYNHPRSVSDDDYPAMKATWTTPAPGKNTTSKQNILDFLKNANLDGLDLDYEPEETTFDATFIAQITNEIKAEGYLMTAAPYKNMPQWETVLKNTIVKDGSTVIANNFSWWNLQTYGGAYYPSWANALQGLSSQIGMTNNEVEAFLLPGYSLSCGSTPTSEIKEIKSSYPSLNGAFIWKYSSIASCLSTQANAILEAIKEKQMA